MPVIDQETWCTYSTGERRCCKPAGHASTNHLLITIVTLLDRVGLNITAEEATA